MNTDPLFSVCLIVDCTEAEALEEEFILEEWNMTSWSDVDTGVVTFQEYFETEDEATMRMAEADDLVPNILGDVEFGLELKRIENRDWTEYWKRFFHAEKVSDRIVIKPSWEDYGSGAGEIVIEIDPGMSFGTGQHPTTRMCLSMLDNMSKCFSSPFGESGSASTISSPLGGEDQGEGVISNSTISLKSLIDLGCGSGILSIAANKLGYKNIMGLDNDSLAVEIAVENATINGVANEIELKVADMDSYATEQKYDVVVINMLASLLNRFAATAVSCLEPGSDSRVIVSGMLEQQYDDTIARYCALGLEVVDTCKLDGWQAAILQCR